MRSSKLQKVKGQYEGIQVINLLVPAELILFEKIVVSMEILNRQKDNLFWIVLQ